MSASAPQLKTRKPTGAVPWPFVLVEGPEKCGKSWEIAELSKSERIGRLYWLDLGEGAADEYAAIPGANYLVLDHDGSWWSIIEQVDAAAIEAQRAADAGEPPVVLAIDSGSNEWDLLKNWADSRARQRRGKGPNDEIVISMDLWNDAGKRHAQLITKLHRFPGIVVVTARGKEVAAMDDNGRPIEGKKMYKVEGQKNLAYDATVWVRMSREHPPLIIGARSVHYGVKPGADDPRRTPPNFTLEALIFDVLKCDPRKAHIRDVKDLSGGELTDEELHDTQDQAPPPASRGGQRNGQQRNGGQQQRPPQQARPVEDTPEPPPQDPQAAPAAAEPAAATEPPSPAKLHRRAGTSVDGLLNALDRARVDAVVAGIEKWEADKLDASPHLTADDRERLGIEPEEQVLVEDVIAYVVAYWKRRNRSPRAPLDGPGEQTSDAA